MSGTLQVRPSAAAGFDVEAAASISGQPRQDAFAYLSRHRRVRRWGDVSVARILKTSDPSLSSAEQSSQCPR